MGLGGGCRGAEPPCFTQNMSGWRDPHEGRRRGEAKPSRDRRGEASRDESSRELCTCSLGFQDLTAVWLSGDAQNRAPALQRVGYSGVHWEELPEVALRGHTEPRSKTRCHPGSRDFRFSCLFHLWIAGTTVSYGTRNTQNTQYPVYDIFDFS